MPDSPDLTPEQDSVRRLLADARHDGPTPPEVVARLDETLASLVAGRTPGERDTSVVDLAARRRRRYGTGVLAAAAVVVAGVALGRALPIGQGSDDAGSAGGADRSTSMVEDDAGAGADARGGAEDDSSAGQELAPQTKPSAPAPLAAGPTLSSGDAALEEELAELRTTTSYSARDQRRRARTLVRTCDLPDLGPGRLVAAEVDGQPGAVLFQRPDGEAQDVAIYVCGTPEPVRTVTLPAP